MLATSPESANCQRWFDRKHSWRHLSEGGFDASRFTVAEIPEAVARAFVLACVLLDSG